jgi:hypothetical protein
MKILTIILFYLVIILEAIYEGLEKKSEIKKKSVFSVIGHLLQIVWIGCILYLGYLLSSFSIWTAVCIYPFARFSIFNLIWNIGCGMNIDYIGKTDIFDKIENWFLKITLMQSNFYLWIKFVVFISTIGLMFKFL